MTRFKWRKQYDDERDAIERANAATIPQGESLTEQHHKKDADINEIMKRFGKGKMLPPAPIDPKFYGDFTDARDFRESMDVIKDARDRFAELPAHIRKTFDNDPTQLWEWVNDERNHDEAVRLGLLKKVTPPKPPEPLQVRVVPDDPPSTNATPGTPAPPKTP